VSASTFGASARGQTQPQLKQGKLQTTQSLQIDVQREDASATKKQNTTFDDPERQAVLVESEAVSIYDSDEPRSAPSCHLEQLELAAPSSQD